jgi:hypothetical protein
MQHLSGTQHEGRVNGHQPVIGPADEQQLGGGIVGRLSVPQVRQGLIEQSLGKLGLLGYEQIALGV